MNRVPQTSLSIRCTLDVNKSSSLASSPSTTTGPLSTKTSLGLFHTSTPASRPQGSFTGPSGSVNRFWVGKHTTTYGLSLADQTVNFRLPYYISSLKYTQYNHYTTYVRTYVSIGVIVQWTLSVVVTFGAQKVAVREVSHMCRLTCTL